MPKKERLFLSINETLEAVRVAFAQYPSQFNLLAVIWPMVFGEAAYIMRDTGNRIAKTCPWLKRLPDRDRYACRIHDVRPSLCRQYPGTRKHARMTGCGGV